MDTMELWDPMLPQGRCVLETVWLLYSSQWGLRNLEQRCCISKNSCICGIILPGGQQHPSATCPGFCLCRHVLHPTGPSLWASVWPRWRMASLATCQCVDQDYPLLTNLIGGGSGALVAKSDLILVVPWTVAQQPPLSIGLSRHEYWSGLPFPSPGDRPDPGIEPGSPALQADALPSELPGKCPGSIKFNWEQWSHLSYTRHSELRAR